MRAPLHLLVLVTFGCGEAFETDGGVGGSTTTAASGTTRASSAAPASNAATTTKASSATTVGSPTTTGTGDPCVDGDYAACIAADMPLLYFGFDVIEAGGKIVSDVPGDGVYLEPAGMAGTCDAGSFIGAGLTCTAGGYEFVGDAREQVYLDLFEGQHAHSVEVWIAEPRVEMGYSQTLFLMFGGIQQPDTSVTGYSTFMGRNAEGMRSITTQRRVYPEGVMHLIGTSIQLDDATYMQPAHVVVSYDGMGTVTLCRNAICTAQTGAEDGPLDDGHWYAGYTRDTQSFTGRYDELAFYGAPLDDATRERHCRAGFAAIGMSADVCTP